jgi:hypothetical protein
MPTSPKQLVEIRSNVISGCKHCQAWGLSDPPDVAERVTHYIKNHGYKLLHVGQETIDDMNGNPWQTTVIIVGK